MKAELNDIHKHYGLVHAVDGVTVRLEPGRIYGLLGENGAGKSTLMRILAGHSQPDNGEIRFNGVDVGRLQPADALERGVGMLYQDPLDFPALKVWENFRLGGRKRAVHESVARLSELADHFHFKFNPEQRVRDLTVGERQQLALIRLLDLGVKLLILDEPTTGITLTQKEMLFAALRRLSAEEDRIIILVTHKLAEAVELCHHILVMRQGRLVGELSPPYQAEDILERMFGPEAVRDAGGRERPIVQDQTLAVLENAEIIGEKFDLPPLSLRIQPGEIIGLAGLEGNGRGLLMRALAGLARIRKGRLSFLGRDMQGLPRRSFRRAGIHFLPAARLEKGLFPQLSLREHLLLAFPEHKKQDSDFFHQRCVQRFRLKATPATRAQALSGGNQQRLQLSLIPDQTKLLLMEHPTRGLDLGSSRQVWEHLEDRCRHGAAVLFSSADLDEIMEHSHRVLVFFNQRIVADIPAPSLTIEVLGGLMAGQTKAA